VPLVEDLVAMGKTPYALARDMEKALSKYIRDPVVTVVVTNFIGPFSEQIRVVGEAARPQALPYKQNMTLLDVMITVGGITDFADGNRSHAPAGIRGRQAVLRAPQGPAPSRRHRRQRRREAGRRAHHSAELVLVRRGRRLDPDTQPGKGMA
jgi:protein involved in polysaccharide export with SLBB domain